MSSWLTRGLRLWASVLAISLVCFVLLEITSRIFFRYSGPITGHNTTATWRISWVNRAHNGSATELSLPLEVFDPLLGWKNRPSFRNVGPLFGADRVTTNSNGARGSTDFPYHRTDKKRVVVVGDSFAFGQEVNDEETYAAVLGSTLSDTEVINLGVIGYGIDQMLLTVKDEALKYSPDLMIVGFISDDIERTLVSFRDFAKPSFVIDSSGRLELLGTPVPVPAVWIANEPWKSKALDTLEILHSDFRRFVGIRRTEAFRLTWMLLKEMARVAEEARMNILFVFEPSNTEIVLDNRPDLVAKDSEAYTSNRAYFASHVRGIARFGEKLFVDFTEQEHVASLNLAPVFRQHHQDGDTSIDKVGHWNKYGHALAAAKIAQKIQSDGLLMPRSEWPISAGTQVGR
jgi:hypothetical protein